MNYRDMKKDKLIAELEKKDALLAKLEDRQADLEQSEEVLRKSEEKYRFLAENTRDIIYSADASGTITYISPQIERYGVRQDEVISSNFAEFIIPEDREKVVREFEETLVTGKYIVSEWRGMDKKGNAYWFEDRGTVKRNEAGEVILLIGILRDITEHKQAEEALRASETKFRELTELLPLSVYEIDTKGKLTYINRVGQEMMEISSEDIADVWDFSSVFVPEDLERARKVMQSRLRGERVGPVEYTLRRKDGTTFPILVQSAPIIRDGKIEGLRGICFDITERKRAEEALKKSEELYRTLVDTSPDAITATDLEGRITFASRQTAELHGFATPEEIIGLNAFDFIIPEERELALDNLKKTLAKGMVRSLEYTLLRRDGSHFLAEMTASLVRDTKGNPEAFIATTRDITKRKELERLLHQSQKMDAIGRLAGSIAHDFNNILGTIMGYCDLISRGTGGDEAVRKETGQIRKAAGRAAALVRQLLAFSRKQVLKPKVVNLNDIVSDMESMLRRIIGEHIEILTGLDPELGSVKADPAQLEQVILNLVVNAREAMPEGGRISIETKKVFFEEIYAGSHVIHEARTCAVLFVGDTGCGMDSDTQSRIFEPFFTSKGKGIGTGLGLSTVYGIVKQSGGDIWVESEPGKGSKFTICFPLVDDVPEPVSERPKSAELPRGSETVLVVEDENDLREALSLMLSGSGYTVFQASDGIEASRLLKQRDGVVDLLITDLVMPKMSGRELAESLKTDFPNLKVIYMSGYFDGTAAGEAALSQDVPFLQKPFTSEVLVNKVREVLDGAKIHEGGN